MNGWMDGVKDNGWMHGRMDGWTDGRTDVWTDGLMNRQVAGRTNGRMNGWMDGRPADRETDGRTDE